MNDQIRRSSRSVCSNLAEGWRKRKYEAVFKNKLTNSMQEASEKQLWIEYVHACSYIAASTFSELDKEYERIIAMLNGIENQAKKFCFWLPLLDIIVNFGSSAVVPNFVLQAH